MKETVAAFCFRLYYPVNVGTAEVPFALGAVLAACALLDLLEVNSAQTRRRLALAVRLGSDQTKAKHSAQSGRGGQR